MRNGSWPGGPIAAHTPKYTLFNRTWLLRIEEAGFEQIIGLIVDDA